MRTRGRSTICLLLAAAAAWAGVARACTSIIVSRGASKDGSVLVTYSADAPFMPQAAPRPGRDHAGRDDGRRPRLGE